jgi:hypothetical protein
VEGRARGEGCEIIAGGELETGAEAEGRGGWKRMSGDEGEEGKEVSAEEGARGEGGGGRRRGCGEEGEWRTNGEDEWRGEWRVRVARADE